MTDAYFDVEHEARLVMAAVLACNDALHETVGEDGVSPLTMARRLTAIIRLVAAHIVLMSEGSADRAADLDEQLGLFGKAVATMCAAMLEDNAREQEDGR